MTVVPGESNSDALIADRSPSYDELSEELAPWLVTNREHGLR
ncbi:MAG: hypothetical protein JWO10_959, partial [Microbacteriaceae bacterium]|nr:hypothetical protein [Microbacteriaceae bacterium]